MVLIPKKENPDNMKDLHPIALCNVLYKIMAKVLENRIKKFFPNIISENQSTFVQGRSITDNVLVAFELIYHLRLKKGEVKFCINGSSVDPVIPKRGLRQGDPLSPYLFLLCVEGNSNDLDHAVHSGTIHGSQISPTTPSISHLLFPDDSFLFFRVTATEAYAIKSILENYERCSGCSKLIISRLQACLKLKKVVIRAIFGKVWFFSMNSLRSGFRWVVGNRESIHATKDQWIRGKKDYHVVNDHSYAGRTEKVSTYIDASTKSWLAPQVFKNFSLEDARAIISIPLPCTDIEDRVVWAGSTSGVYTAKEGYKHWINLQNNAHNITPSAGWKRLWSLFIPNKIKIFAWRVWLVLNMSQVEDASVWLLDMLANGNIEESTKICTVLWGHLDVEK
ncbi:uncharacterized protein LOC141665255 [Apium graveolens]|uniref:uncharacterized protein LOC141665255 n=1 Tax=Apium graveolens TaxID=4045 RepID=UPI003D7A78D1